MGRLMLYTRSLTTCTVQTGLLLTPVPVNALMREREAEIFAFEIGRASCRERV